MRKGGIEKNVEAENRHFPEIALTKEQLESLEAQAAAKTSFYFEQAAAVSQLTISTILQCLTQPLMNKKL